MTKDEFNRLRGRFGEDVATWPAPYRQEAALSPVKPNDEVIMDDDALDQLILEAVLVPTDERTLTRKVLSRIGQTPQPIFDFAMMPFRSSSAIAAGTVLVLMISAVSGYIAASNSNELPDDLLLAFATGEPPDGLVEAVGMNNANGG
jgi:hypothetical protein